MKRLCYVILPFVLMVIVVPVSAIDHLDLLTTMSGEFSGSRFGYKLVSMDYNGDGYQDLIVHSQGWNPTGVFDMYNAWGRIYFYWGGSGFDNVADFTINGTHHGGMTLPISNAGDVNGDGIEDLIVPISEYQVAIYYGSLNPTGIPGLIINTNVPNDPIIPYPLGDVNGDGNADIAMTTINYHSDTIKIFIWTGIDQPWHEVVALSNTSGEANPYGVGDVNGDSIADYVVHHNISEGDNTDQRIVLYYGNQNFPQVDSLVISANTNCLAGRGACPLGDVNDDGYNDFMTYESKIWYGGEDITATPDIALDYQTEWHHWNTMAYSRIPYCIYGDLNDDGYDDVIGSNPDIGYYRGDVGIWLGAANMNGECDLYIRPPLDYETCQFGWDKATGDFNGDGICDLAVSAPEYYSAPQWAEGRVFVYLGSTQFVANEDLLIPNAGSSQWQINLYPNPYAHGEGLQIEFDGEGYKHSAMISLDIYNIKGQRVSSIDSINPDSSYQLPEYITSKLSAGIYLVAVKKEQATKFMKKFCVIK